MRFPFLSLLAALLLALPVGIEAADGDIVVHEILYHPGDDNTGGEYIEIHNRGSQAVNLGGWTITDAVDFVFPAVTLESDSYLVVCRDQVNARVFYGVTNTVGDFGGRLDSAGDNIVLRNSSGVLIDVVRYSDGSHPVGVDPWPTEADGAGPSLELRSSDSDNALPESWGIGQPFTPGLANDAMTPGGGAIVVTEIMYRPRKMRFAENLDPRKGGYWWEDGDDPDGEYVEIYNRGATTVDLSGWSFNDGLSFAFGAGTQLGSGEYLVVCGNAATVGASYAIDNVVGDFTGQLNDGGERLTLVDDRGLVVDTVRYRDEHPWPIGPDQTGQALELLDPLSDNDRADNWRTSRALAPDEPDLTQVPPPEGEWQFVETTGVATSNMPDDSHPFFIFVNGPGTWLMDDLRVTAEGGGPNLTPEGSFENGDAGWLKRGNHSSTATTDAEARVGDHAERISATGAGGSSSNSFIWPDIEGMVTGERYTISFWARHLDGASVSFRLSGGGLRTTVDGILQLLDSQSPLAFQVGTEFVLTRGTPGEDNSVAAVGIPPLARELSHSPVRPRSNQSVTIFATVTADVPVTEVLLNVRIYDAPYAAPDETPTPVMRDDGVQDNGIAGDGVYGARIEAQPSQTLVRYRVTVGDQSGLSWTWPDEGEPNPERAFFVYDGEEETNLPAYFLILPPESEVALADSLEAFSEDLFTTELKKPVDGAVVIDGIVHDHVRVRYRSDRLVSKHSFKIKFNKTEYYQGMRTIDTNYDWPTTEKAASNLFFLVGQGQTNIAMEPIRWYENGRFAGVFVAQESPDRTWLGRVGLDDAGEVFKAKASGGCCSGFDPTFPSCPRASDSCAADLRWLPHYDASNLPSMYIKRSDSLGSYQSLEDFILELRDTPDEALVGYLQSRTELHDWLYKSAVHVMQPHCDYHAKNYYVTRSPGVLGKWNVIYFDYDIFWGCQMHSDQTCYAVNIDARCSGTNLNARVYGNSQLYQLFLQIVDDVARTILTEDRVYTMLDDLFAHTARDRDDERDRVRGSRVTSDSRLPRIKDNFRIRRNFLLNSFLPAQGLTPPSNAHPLIELSEPVEVVPGEVEIQWTQSDPEGDTATVDLYWTDLGFSHYVPILGACGLVAGENGEGSFRWSFEVPDSSDRPVYIYAEIDDGQGVLVGRDTSVPVVPFGVGGGVFRRGDVDDSGALDITDAVNSLVFQFLGSFQPPCLDALDVDDSGAVDISDPILGLAFQFLGDVMIPAPFPECGLDPTIEDSELDCGVVASCP
jgi:hypothetical protein